MRIGVENEDEVYKTRMQRMRMRIRCRRLE